MMFTNSTDYTFLHFMNRNVPVSGRKSRYYPHNEVWHNANDNAALESNRQALEWQNDRQAYELYARKRVEVV